MSVHLNLSTGKFLNSSTLFKLSDALLLDLSSGEIVMSNLLVPRVGVDLFKLASLDLNFAQSKSLTDRVSGNNLVTFSRASTALYRGSDGLIKTAAVDAPRFDHDPVTGESLGLLIEESSTNKIKYSEDFNISTTTWTQTNSGTTSLSGVLSPDGVTYMSLIDLSATAGSVSAGSRVYHTSLGFNASDQTFSFYARSVSGTGTFPVGYFNGTNYIKEYVTLTETTKRYTMIVPSSVSTGDILGWTRRGDTQLETLDQALVWGAQFEDAGYPSSYIRSTSGTSVTRSADVASITGTNFSSWYNQGEGSFVAKVDRYDTLPTTKFTVLTTNGFRLPEFSFGTAGNATIFATNTTTYTSPAALLKASFGWSFDGNGVSKYINGVGSTTTESVTDTNTALYLGSHLNTTHWHNGHISRLAFFPTRKTEQELIRITDGTIAPAIITYRIASGAGGTFNLRSTGTVDYAVDWDSTGGYEESTSNTLAHTYTAGNYDLVVHSDGVYRPYFNNVTADVTQITSVVINSGADLGTVLPNSWHGASNMTTFTCPFSVTSSVINFNLAWRDCSSLTSFPLLDTSSGTRFIATWRDCSSLASFPANMFDTTGTLIDTAFSSSWFGCALTAQSIENILVSLDTNGATGITLGLNGGTNAAKTTWSTAANTAYDNLIVKGWTIAFNA